MPRTNLSPQVVGGVILGAGFALTVFGVAQRMEGRAGGKPPRGHAVLAALLGGMPMAATGSAGHGDRSRVPLPSPNPRPAGACGAP
jgi:hypothetical protein